jgi:hypothetical protein
MICLRFTECTYNLKNIMKAITSCKLVLKFSCNCLNGVY